MLRPIIQIKFIQQPTKQFPNRNSVFVMPFVNDCEVHTSWKNLTDTCKIKFPKNIIIRKADGSQFMLKDANKFINGRQENNENPFLLRGDKIEVQAGYIFIDVNGQEQDDANILFSGYVSKVQNKMPIEIECEDNMYALKQIFISKKSYANAELSKLLADILQGTGYTFTTGGMTMNLGNLRIENQTIAEVLEYIRKTFHVESYFRGNVLHCSPFVYYPETNKNPPKLFQFQKNIISDELQYTRADDVKIGCKAYSINKEELSTNTFDGRQKTKATRLEIFVTKDNKGNVVVQDLTGGVKSGIDEGSFGNVVTLFFPEVTTIKQLTTLATAKLNRLYYEGFRGKFTTFGLPYVTHGDQVTLTDKVLPERNGTYFVKSVVYNFGMNGFRQHVEIDLRIDGVFNDKDLSNGI